MQTEAEKKLVAGLLGKLYVSPTSSEEKLRESYGIVSEAVEEGLVTDTTGRNALYKIHVSLGKIVNSLEEQRPAQNRDGRSTSETAERSTPEEAEAETEEPEAEPEAEEAEEEEEPEEQDEPVVKSSRTRGNPKIKKEESSDDEGTVIPEHRDDESLVELSDEDTKMEDVY
jgi:condensin complex subunit 3